MSLLEKAVNLVRANINDMLDKAEDPEKMINLYLEDAGEHLVQMKEAVHSAITAEKLLQGQWDEAKEKAEMWQKRAVLAVKKDNDKLATEALNEKKKAEIRMAGLKEPLAKSKAQVEQVKANTEALEEKIEDTKNNAVILIARAKAAKATKESAETLAGISKKDPLAGMKSQEEKIMTMEAQAAAATEMIGTHKTNLEKEFQALEGGANVEDELAALKKKHGKTTEQK